MHSVNVRFRRVLLSSGNFTPEAVIDDGYISVFESSPEGLTVGLKEKTKGQGDLPNDFSFDYDGNLSQLEFDSRFTQGYTGDISTALSLAYLKYRAAVSGISNLSDYLSQEFGFTKNKPSLIFNILNGGKHSGNGLSFCEFMIIPRQEDPHLSILIASEVYNDLRSIILKSYGEEGVLVGREGGFAPYISDIDTALDLIVAAINIRHPGEVSIAIDVAANHFATQEDGSFLYRVNQNDLTSNELLSYYRKLLSKHPEITYIEDPFHEEDLGGWSLMINEFGKEISIVADDLTVSNAVYLKEYQGLYNGCILKVNQVGTVSGLIEALVSCKQRKIKTIISQRSGETDSNILPYLAIGLGADYMKAGAPARERIIKYNELLRM